MEALSMKRLKLPAMEPIIMKNMMILMMPQTASPQRTARTHLMNSFML